jgi:hypothetical protein
MCLLLQMKGLGFAAVLFLRGLGKCRGYGTLFRTSIGATRGSFTWRRGSGSGTLV